jgi:phage gpG-like protein
MKNGKTVAKPTTVTEYLVTGESYRAGGKPLRDTGQMMREMNAKGQAGGNGVSIILYGPLHAIFHELGFETSGPNYIPLTRKGKRSHATGNNPTKEGLVRGKDFVMAWQGVTVPKRPFMIPTNDEWGEIGKSIRLGLARILKGRS